MTDFGMTGLGMALFDIHVADLAVLAAYFALVLYLGVFLGARKTKSLGDFFVAGGKWGSLVSFIFVFASALAGNEAVVVASGGFKGGLSGVWYWWSFLFATPVYYLFSTYYRRARVYNLAEFLEMRYGRGVAALYAVVAGVLCILFIGMFVLAIGKIIAGFTGLPVQVCVWTITVIVGAYVASGGMMSALLTDLMQGVMCLCILGFIGLPFVWKAAGGLDALKSLPAERWSFTSESMTVWTVVALNVSALAGGVAAPWIYNWIAISKNERAATQCGWGHLWKRLITLLFALYGIFFFLIMPDTDDPEQLWGAVMAEVLPSGVGLIGLLVASFFAAAMSSADTYATTSSAMMVDFVYRRVLRPGRTAAHYLACARGWAVLSILIAAVSTLYITSIEEYVKLAMSLLGFLGIPIYLGIAWREANQTGTWMSLGLGIVSYLTIKFALTGEGRVFADSNDAFVASVFVPTGLSFVGMFVGSLIGRRESDVQLNRFYAIVRTPIGQERRLVEAGVSLPALVDAGLIEDGPEELKVGVLESIHADDAADKYFGPNSAIELRRERSLPWYGPGFVWITLACVGLVAVTWLVVQILFVRGS